MIFVSGFVSFVIGVILVNLFGEPRWSKDLNLGDWIGCVMLLCGLCAMGYSLFLAFAALCLKVLP